MSPALFFVVWVLTMAAAAACVVDIGKGKYGSAAVGAALTVGGVVASVIHGLGTFFLS